jgi:uncharacterized membrane protein YuzA (DUF378 family)
MSAVVMPPEIASETAMLFLIGAICALWAGASIAYLLGGLIGVGAIWYTIANGLHGDAGLYVWLLTIALLVTGYLRDHPQRN